MKRRLLVAVTILVASGYELDLAFRGMNAPSDLTYIAGIIGTAVWFLFIVPTFWHFTTKGKSHEKTASVPAGAPNSK